MYCSPWGCEESDTTERLYFHFSLSCIGEGNGNPLQCSCLENPRDGGACWAAVYGVTQSRTQLKQLSSSSSRIIWKILGVQVTVNAMKRQKTTIYIDERLETKMYKAFLEININILFDTVLNFCICLSYELVIPFKYLPKRKHISIKSLA